jgi:type VI secretion system secreted protein Hcp
MAHTITLKVGTITGDSKGIDSDPAKKISAPKTHVNEIDCISWHWGISQTSKSSAGGGMSTADVQDLTITKWVDSATPNLLSNCFAAIKQVTGDPPYQGQAVGVVLTLFKNVNGSPVEFMVIKLLDNVIVSSVNTGDAGEGDMYTETVRFKFTKAVVVYTKDDGKASETPIRIA